MRVMDWLRACYDWLIRMVPGGNYSRGSGIHILRTGYQLRSRTRGPIPFLVYYCLSYYIRDLFHVSYAL